MDGAFLGERQMRIYPNTSTKRQRVSPETHLLALRAGMNSPAARLTKDRVLEIFLACRSD